MEVAVGLSVAVGLGVVVLVTVGVAGTLVGCRTLVSVGSITSVGFRVLVGLGRSVETAIDVVNLSTGLLQALNPIPKGTKIPHLRKSLRLISFIIWVL